MDSFFLGDACIKPKEHPTHGICDLCYYCLGRKTKETLKHLLITCPFSRPVTLNYHRGVIRSLYPDYRSTLDQMDSRTFAQTFLRRIVTGCNRFESTATTKFRDISAVTAAAVITAILERRHNNIHNTHSNLEFTPDTAIKRTVPITSLKPGRKPSPKKPY